MIKLKIKNADGSTYWEESFGTVEAKDKWLAEEQTRPYWKQDFVVEVTDVADPVYIPSYLENRLLEYPSYAQFIEAFYDDYVLKDKTAMDALMNAVAATKTKYPKP